MEILNCKCTCIVSGVWTVGSQYEITCPMCENSVRSSIEEQTIRDWNSWMSET